MVMPGRQSDRPGAFSAVRTPAALLRPLAELARGLCWQLMNFLPVLSSIGNLRSLRMWSHAHCLGADALRRLCVVPTRAHMSAGRRLGRKGSDVWSHTFERTSRMPRKLSFRRWPPRRCPPLRIWVWRMAAPWGCRPGVGAFGRHGGNLWAERLWVQLQ